MMNKKLFSLEIVHYLQELGGYFVDTQSKLMIKLLCLRE